MFLGMSYMTIALACLASLGIFLLSVAFLIDWIRNWRRIRGYWAYGLAAGLIVLGFDLLGVLATPSLWTEMSFPAVVIVALIIGLAIDAILATRVAGFAMLGVHYATVMGHPSFPFLQQVFPARLTPADGASLPSGASAAPTTAPGRLVAAAEATASVQAPQGHGPATCSTAGTWPVPDPQLRNAALSALAVATLSVAYSAVLFTLASPTQSQIIRWLSQFAPQSPRLLNPRAFILVLAAAFAEEVIFRLGMQSFLARYLNWSGGRYWLAIILTSTLWTLGHVGTIEPGWVKAAQIFPIGLLLGRLYRSHGVEACIVAHSLFNVVLLPLSSSLMG